MQLPDYTIVRSSYRDLAAAANLPPLPRSDAGWYTTSDGEIALVQIVSDGEWWAFVWCRNKDPRDDMLRAAKLPSYC